MSDGAYFIGLRRGLGWFGDGHTTPLPFEFTGGVPDKLKAGAFGLSLPLRIGVFHDGAFVVAASAGHSGPLGKRVTQIGSLATEEIIRRNATDWPGNRAWAHRWAGGMLASPAELHGLGAIGDFRTPVRYSTAGRPTLISPIRSSDFERVDVERKATVREGWAKEAGGGNYVHLMDDRKAVYISIDDMDDVKGKTFGDLTRDAFAAMAKPGVDRIIVDLRRNGGGNNFWGEPLRKGLAASRFNRPGGLYVLISPITFSAAQNLANRLERETFATFVGQPTGGAPNHYGDAKAFQGPATGITAIVSTLPWFDSYPQDERPWIMPDIPVPQTFDDWRSGQDRALEMALAHQASDKVDFLSRNSVFFYGRPSQKAEWKPFWI